MSSYIKKEIQMLLIQNDITMSQLVSSLNKKYGREDTIQNLNNKLTRGTIKFSEIKEIAEVLNYKLAWIPNDVYIEAGKNGVYYSPNVNK
ncbi:hypothetical protein SAMN04487895_101762 [Paenibacillus sophorae]|uniref:LLM class flavin-dependent oxidoreductase n=1 Tax=Paenibacillus sophorae TaxID=1333845 RepID=A0A1H8H542_9BACL|nr:DUF6471 domain-containing protein [Paenibacillus sophorae]QWU14450.1 LLM class flavin-dependent oxidoreductase [Paenibacillus sophorae]SEN51472.1 hypothetical protein SAMN04487895_101762 [Paenibacillus sophorae]